MLQEKKKQEIKKEINGEVVVIDDMEMRIYQLPPRAWDTMTICENRILRTGDLLIDPYGKVIYKNGKLLDVTITQFEIICCLVENVTLVVSRRRLKELIYNRCGHWVADNTLTKHINRTRKILGQEYDWDYILTRNGRGYKWGLPVTSSYIVRRLAGEHQV